MSTSATEPVVPATSTEAGAPATAQTPAAEAAADAVAQQLLAAATSAPATAGETLPDDPEALKAEIAKLRRENASARTTAKANAADEARKEIAQAVGKALGIVDDETPVDPTKLAEQVAASTAEAKQAKLEVAIYAAAAASNVDAAALLDSRTFLAKAAALDPTDSTALVAAIGEAVTANPALARIPAATGVPAFNPALGTSSNGQIKPKTAAEQIAEAEKAGDWQTAQRLKAGQLFAQPIAN